MHYELWRQPHGERTRLVNNEQGDEQGDGQGDEPRDEPRDVLTKPKILPVKIELRIVEAHGNVPTRYVLSAATYQRLVDAVPKVR